MILQVVRTHQNELGTNIVHMKSFFNQLLRRTGSYTMAKNIMRTEYHIFVNIK